MFVPPAMSRIAAAALVALAVPAHAAFTVYTTPASFATATASLVSGTDTFSTVPLDFVASPSSRSAGIAGYSVSAPGGLFGSGSAADVWLSTNLSGDVMTFSGFTGGTRAIGGSFFGTDLTGSFLAGQTMILTATDSLGARSIQTLTNATQTSFAGWLTNGELVSLTVEIGSRNAYATTNNLTIAAVPEPETYALLLVGLGAVGLCARRRSTR